MTDWGSQFSNMIFGNSQLKQPPIVRFRQQAATIQANMPPLADEMTRLWRGNRPGEVGVNPSFTSDLAGIALPFQKGYGGPLSYVDVPTAHLGTYQSGAGATDAEYILPSQIAAKAQAIPFTGPSIGPGVATRPLSGGLMGAEEYFQSLREGLAPPQ